MPVVSEDSGSKGQRWRPVTPEPGQFSPLLPPSFPLPTLQPLWSSPWPCSPRGRQSAPALDWLAPTVRQLTFLLGRGTSFQGWREVGLVPAGGGGRGDGWGRLPQENKVPLPSPSTSSSPGNAFVESLLCCRAGKSLEVRFGPLGSQSGWGIQDGTRLYWGTPVPELCCDHTQAPRAPLGLCRVGLEQKYGWWLNSKAPSIFSQLQGRPLH